MILIILFVQQLLIINYHQVVRSSVNAFVKPEEVA